MLSKIALRHDNETRRPKQNWTSELSFTMVKSFSRKYSACHEKFEAEASEVLHLLCKMISQHSQYKSDDSLTKQAFREFAAVKSSSPSGAFQPMPANVLAVCAKYVRDEQVSDNLTYLLKMAITVREFSHGGSFHSFFVNVYHRVVGKQHPLDLSTRRDSPHIIPYDQGDGQCYPIL